MYETTIVVNKLRTFYKIKEGLLREKFDDRIRDLEQKMQNHNEIYENLVETKKREFLLKKELLFVQRVNFSQKRHFIFQFRVWLIKKK